MLQPVREVVILRRPAALRTNLALWSEQFENAVWTKAAGGTGAVPVVTANAGTDPIGGATADRVQFDRGAGVTGADTSIVQQVVTAFSNGTGSIYLKTNDASTKSVGFRVGATASTVSVTGTWQRFTISVAGSINQIRLQLIGNAHQQTADLLVWGAQMETGATMTAYIGPTGATAVSAP